MGSYGTKHRASLSISHPTSQMQPINIILSTYTGENLMIFGICDVQVDQSQILPLLVMHGHRLYSFYMLSLWKQPCTCSLLKTEPLGNWTHCKVS